LAPPEHVYAEKITRSETDAATGEESEYAIPFFKGYPISIFPIIGVGLFDET
jgi:antirestriction protein ArdC